MLSPQFNPEFSRAHLRQIILESQDPSVAHAAYYAEAKNGEVFASLDHLLGKWERDEIPWDELIAQCGFLFASTGFFVSEKDSPEKNPLPENWSVVALRGGHYRGVSINEPLMNWIDERLQSETEPPFVQVLVHNISVILYRFRNYLQIQGILSHDHLFSE